MLKITGLNLCKEPFYCFFLSVSAVLKKMTSVSRLRPRRGASVDQGGHGHPAAVMFPASVRCGPLWRGVFSRKLSRVHVCNMCLCVCCVLCPVTSPGFGHHSLPPSLSCQDSSRQSADPTFPDVAADARCLGPRAQDSDAEAALGPPGLCAVPLPMVVAFGFGGIF